MSDGATASKWSDLGPRLISALVLIVVGAAALWAGGLWFDELGVLIVGVMLWELVRMLAPGHPTMAWQVALVGAITLEIALFVPFGISMLMLGLFLIVAVGRVGQHVGLLLAYGAGIWLAGLALVTLREEGGLFWTLWLIGVVVVTDIAGYFAGRIIGGPKFWPQLSPKKTWSGTVAGWIAAAALSAWMSVQYDLPWGIVMAAVALSFASQMGDIAESALKRRMKVKDSSNLIPGHGGVMDRFDGMMGAALMMSAWLIVQGAL
ncbi:phosphatidate cytidylyltransferase [Marimonas lutisalis]|uniref:phosphatidate cytidylyltransferase n=1 Tax=Marimonas lutisalis TaxID=2545756 RepID=UPI0010F9851A|nr:phosphatidate cytidylyltransferase [Marimonas lutisalis]